VPLFGLQTPRDLLVKLKKDAEILDDEVTAGRFFNFAITAYHLMDWVKNSPAATEAVKSAAEAMHRDRWIKVCGDLPNTGKHLVLASRTPITEKAELQQGYGVGRFGKGGYGLREEEIIVTLEDGGTMNCLDLVKTVVKIWDSFFHTHGL
jgi:hypothetical protein